jgi:hypothetical protein
MELWILNIYRNKFPYISSNFKVNF